MSFSINEYIYKLNKSQENYNNDVNTGYPFALAKVRELVSKNYSTELAQVINSVEAENRLKNIIMKIINAENLADVASDNVATLTDKLYNDMAGLSFLTSYLQDEDVEEININGHSGIFVQYPDRKERLNQAFINATELLNMVKKMSNFGNVILDGTSPIGDSYITREIRMTAVINPCVDSNIGAIASIRKQKPNTITRDKIISWGTTTEEQMNFLETCVQNGVSLGICGGTGAGKTADMGLILKTIPHDKRIVTIEDTSELNLQIYDDNGFMLNDVVHLLTLEGRITMQQLVKKCLRLDPEYLIPAEMRGAEALDVQEAGRTGHTIVSTLHANSAKAAYERILTMCLQAGTKLSEERLLKNIIEAFPLMLYKEKLPDGSRKYMEVFEATGISPNGEVEGNYIYEFVVEGYERCSQTGIITKVIGEHRKTGGISDRLVKILTKKGVPKAIIDSFKI